MRRTYISPEFEYRKVNGTMNMKEQSSFFGSKMLEIDDEISVNSDNLVYYQSGIGEQIDLDSEMVFPNIYSAINNKNQNHTLTIDNSQGEYDRIINTRWILDININNILVSHIFAIIKKWRTFEGVKNDMTIKNNVDYSIRRYIEMNILDRYEVKNIEMYFKLVNTTTNGSLKYRNSYNSDIELQENIFTKFSLDSLNGNNLVRILFTQNSKPDDYSFDYYFNITFSKI